MKAVFLIFLAILEGLFWLIAGIFYKRPIRIKILGRAGMIYYENEKKLMLDSELLAGGDYDYAVRLSEAHCWEHPYENESLTASDRDRIKTNIEKQMGGRILFD